VTDRKTVKLPFDLTEVVNDLRSEHYLQRASHVSHSSGNKLLHQIYYGIRPLLPLKVRKHLQKIHLRGWRDLAFPAWPVDTTVDQLMEKILRLTMKAQGIDRMPFIWFWPDGAAACSIMTHDVEEERGRAFCSQLMDINESFGIPASFQIVPERRYQVTADFLQGIKERGFEVNVQDLYHDGKLFRKHKEFRRRAAMINAYCRQYDASGFRSAILYRNQDWYDAFNFEYDMSVPNVAHLDPQRGGCCTVMPYFIGDMVELPVTTTQDHTLFNILNDYSLDLWKQQIEIILQKCGLISFIVHPDYILSERAQNTYKALLQLLTELRSERDVWIALPAEVNRWWRQRNQMTLASTHGRWEISGEGSERAQMAYATLEGEQLTYSLSEPAFYQV
jgi:hypothetical protein